jgi:prepilin-type N-terminal cleavage/methylation domain-containing protein
MKKIYVKTKKAFTLLELLLVLCLISILGVYAIKEYLHGQFTSNVFEMQETIEKDIFEIAMYDPILGYAAGIGGDCSSNIGMVTDLDTDNFRKCARWNSIDLPRFDLVTISGVDYLSGRGLLEEYGSSLSNVNVNGVIQTSYQASGCLFTLRQVPGDEYQYDVFVDCSRASVETRRLAFLEEAIDYVFQMKLNGKTQIVYSNAVDLTTSLSNETSGTGNSSDGMIRARLGL